MNRRDNQPIETLRISERDKAKLLWAIEESSRRKVDDSKRRLRVTTTNNEGILTLIGDTGTRTRLAVLVRDLSRWGASIVHGRYIYPGTRCELELKSLDGTVHTRHGEIRHVRHVQGLIHNLGISFDNHIDLSEFVVLTPEEESLHLQELADDMPAEDLQRMNQVTHRVLVVDDFASDRKLLSYWLTRAGMEVVAVADGKTAMERIEDTQFSLAIIDSQLGQETGPDLVSKLRNSQFVAPILSVSANDMEDVESRALKAGANSFMVKPFTAEQLIERAHELMGVSNADSHEPIVSQFNDDQSMRPLLTAFTRGLSGYIEQLQEANSTNNYETLEEVSRTLKGAGSGYGLPPISTQAGEVLLALNDNAADMNKIRKSVNELISILSRVKLR